MTAVVTPKNNNALLINNKPSTRPKMNHPTMPLPQRLNGLTPPYSGPQIAALAAFMLTILEFVVVVAPSLPICSIAPVSLVFIGVICAVINFGAKAVLIDPMDAHVIEHWRQQNRLPTCRMCSNTSPDDSPTGGDANTSPLRNTNLPLTKLERIYVLFNQQRHEEFRIPQEPMKHCWICDLPVADHSMHCKFCNKCVYHFDHHCMWLNTCIGKANYKPFYRLMWALIVMEVMHLVLHIFLILNIMLDGDYSSPYRSKIPLVIIFFLFLLFNVLSILLIGQLIVFHMKLQQKRLTTYAYIIQEHKEKRELARRMGDLEAKRIALIDQSSGMQKCLLQLGGFCRNIGLSAFDPLDLPPVYVPDPEAGFAAAIGPPRTTELATIAPRENAPAPLAENEDDTARREEEKMFEHDEENGDNDDESPYGPQINSRMLLDIGPQQHSSPTAPMMLAANGTTMNGTPDPNEPNSLIITRTTSGQDWSDSMTTSIVPDVFENEPIDDQSGHSLSRHRSETGARLSSSC